LAEGADIPMTPPGAEALFDISPHFRAWSADHLLRSLKGTQTGHR